MMDTLCNYVPCNSHGWLVVAFISICALLYTYIRRVSTVTGTVSRAEIKKDYVSNLSSPEYKNIHPPPIAGSDERDQPTDFPDYAALTGVPLPRHYKGFDIRKAKARPYRPFRWLYHQNMSLFKLEPDWWIELEDTYVERIKQRQALFEQHGKDILQYTPGSELACKELMEMALQFLCARYPHYFSLEHHNSVFYNRILGTREDLRASHPLHVLLNHVPEDFAIMLRDPGDGLYYFRAGMICSALGWSLGSKFGKPLRDIHAPVPDYKEKMQFSMDRFFAKMPTDKPIQRGSWGFEVGQPLFAAPNSAEDASRNTKDASLEISQVHLRVDWQTLRRLPRSQAVVFNFKALFTPVEDFREEPYIPALVLKIIRESKSSLMDYKVMNLTQHVLEPALERWADEQTKNGLASKDWEPRTLNESPLFPNWEAIWRRRQGFGP